MHVVGDRGACMIRHGTSRQIWQYIAGTKIPVIEEVLQARNTRPLAQIRLQCNDTIDIPGKCE